MFIQVAGGPAEVAYHFSKNGLMPPNADQTVTAMQESFKQLTAFGNISGGQQILFRKQKQ